MRYDVGGMSHGRLKIAVSASSNESVCAHAASVAGPEVKRATTRGIPSSLQSLPFRAANRPRLESLSMPCYVVCVAVLKHTSATTISAGGCCTNSSSCTIRSRGRDTSCSLAPRIRGTQRTVAAVMLNPDSQQSERQSASTATWSSPSSQGHSRGQKIKYRVAP